VKKIAAYSILAIAIIAVIIIAFFAMNWNTKPTASGTLKVSITDAPVDLSKLEVTIDSIEVQSQNSSWVNLAFIDGVQSVKVDLLTLQNITQELSTTQISTGNYTKIRLHVQDATATYEDDTTDNLTVPSEKIDVIIHFEIKENETTNVLVDMTADSAAISASHNLRPVLKATVESSETAKPTPTSMTSSPTPTST